MRQHSGRFPLAVVALLTLAAAAQGQYARRTAIVEAVDRTRHGIVTLKVNKSSEYSRRSIVGTRLAMLMP